MKDNLELKSNCLLLVEGNDEYWFCIQLLKSIGFNSNPEQLDIQVIDMEGNQNFSSSLNLITKLPKFDQVTTIGFIRDAEQNTATSAYSSTCDSIKKFISNFPIPEIGEVKSENGLSCGIFITPDNSTCGMLETVCLESVKTNPLYKESEVYVDNAESLLPESDRKKYNKPKAMVQTYLAGQLKIVNTLANAAKRNIWDYSNPVFAGIVSFIRKLVF